MSCCLIFHERKVKPGTAARCSTKRHSTGWKPKNGQLFTLLKRITSSTRPRRGGSCLKDIYIYIYVRPFSSIELACAVRQPSPCVRALCETGVLFHMSHLKLHFTLHTWQSSHSTLHTSHCTLHTALFALHTPHSSHFTLRSSHSTLHTSHCALHSPHFTLHSSHSKRHTSQSTLHTPHFTLHSSCPTLHTAPFISSELFSPYPSWALLISSLLICHLSFHESLPSTTTKELARAVRQPGPCVRALCEAVAMLLSKNMTCARPRCNATWSKHFPHTSHCTLHTSHLSSFHLVACLPICQLRSSWLFSCHALELLSHALELLSTYLGASARQQGWA